MTREHRDKIHIIKDIIVLLAQHGQLNQTALMSYSGLNLTKHKHIIDEMESNGMITRSVLRDGKRTVTVYKATLGGLEFCKNIIGPYEELFPRKADGDKNGLGLLILV